MQGIHEKKFPRPSRIQGSALGLIMKLNEDGGYDHLIAQAKNGSGKTAAFVLGSLMRVDPSISNTQVICVVHTREMVNQITAVYKELAKYTSISITNDPKKSDKTQVVVCTVHKAKEYLERGRKSLAVQCFIADEADLLFEDKNSG